MSNQPKISVIIPIYKVEKYLVQCLESIVNQTLRDIEIIPVDEGDMDACRYIIDHYEQTDKRVIAIHEKNGGYGASVNKGFDIAKGEYISIIESDDFIEPTMFEEMYNYAKKLDADVVKTPYYEYWEKTKKADEKKQLCFWYEKVQHVPENKLFKIEDYPILVAIHPSIWAALYKNDYLKKKNIRCIEAKGAGYIDNHFRIQTLCQTDKIAWLNKPFNYYRLSNPDASVANYNLGAFIQRWADVHKLFEEKIPEKWETLAPYCIEEEWINTYSQIVNSGFKITEKQKNLLMSNLSYVSNEHIEKSDVLSKDAKVNLLKLKKFPNKINKYVVSTEASVSRKSQYKEFYQLNILGIPLLKIKEKEERKWKIYLFGFLLIAKCEKY